MRVSRNAPCPCGSGRKHKKCCLLNSAGDVESDPVPATAIVAVMLEFSKLSPGDFQKAIKTTVEKHRTLLDCAIQVYETLPEAVFRSALISTVVSIRAFENHYGAEVPEVGHRQIARYLEGNGRAFFEGSDAYPDIPAQPFVLRFLADAIKDMDSMTDFERFSLFVMMKTFVHALSNAYRESSLRNRVPVAVSG